MNWLTKSGPKGAWQMNWSTGDRALCLGFPYLPYADYAKGAEPSPTFVHTCIHLNTVLGACMVYDTCVDLGH